MKVLAMMVFVVVMMVACGGEEGVLTSGEIYCTAFFECEETSPTFTFDECVIEYDSNLCNDESTSSCFREFTTEEKKCLVELDSCVLLGTGGNCLSEKF
ncbi:MAG TPA: hypothetical protein PK151_06900 [Caldisericia bacterium]|nr:hypothetical protein [Caldisericia bacterium]